MTFMSYDLACVKYDILEGSVNFNSSVCIITFGNIYTCTTDESSRLRSAAVHVKVIRISDHWGPSTASADSYMNRNKTQRHAMFSNTHKHCQEKNRTRLSVALQGITNIVLENQHATYLQCSLFYCSGGGGL